MNTDVLTDYFSKMGQGITLIKLEPFGEKGYLKRPLVDSVP